MGIFAIGDIHGYSSKLEALISKLPLSASDKLVFIGDYIDRGPDSSGVISLLLQLREDYDSKFLCGNHEHMICDYIQGCKTYDRGLWLANGGLDCLDSYDISHAEPGNLNLPSEHIEFFMGLEYYHIEPGFVFVHGGLTPGSTPAESNWKDILWSRSAFYACPYRWPEGIVVFGHTPFEEPLVLPNKIGIDTGCAYGGSLTAVRLPEIEFYQT